MRTAVLAGLAYSTLTLLVFEYANTSLALHLSALLGGKPGPQTVHVALMLSLVMGFPVAAYYAGVLPIALWLRRQASRRPTPSYQPRVSIIVPVYNGADTLGATLRCLLDQDYPRKLMEVIVVDDGSTDESYSIARYYQQKYNGLLKVLRNPVNLGKPETLTRGVRAARGEVIVFVDDDTLLERTALKRLVSRFADPTVGLVCGRILPANPHGLVGRLQEVEYILAFDVGRSFQEALGVLLVASGAMAAMNSIVAKTLLAVPEDTVAEDFDLTLITWKRGFRVAHEPTATAYTRVPSSWRSLYRQRLRWYYGGLQVLAKHVDLLRLRRGARVARLSIALLAYMLTIEYLLPLLQVIGYILFPLTILATLLLGVDLLGAPLPDFLAAYASSYTLSVLYGSLAVTLPALLASKGAKELPRMLVLALLYHIIFIPLQAVAKLHSLLRFAGGHLVAWGR